MTKIEICIYISHKREEKRGYLIKQIGISLNPFYQVTFSKDIPQTCRKQFCYYIVKALFRGRITLSEKPE